MNSAWHGPFAPGWRAILLALAGCATSDPGIPPLGNSASPNIETHDGGSNTGTYLFSFAKEDRRFDVVVPGTVEEARTNVMRAFATLGIPANVLKTTPLVIGSERIVLRRMFDGKPLATFLDCGTTNVGPVANVYRIQAALLAAVHPARPEGVRIETRLTAQGVSNDGASGGGVDCTTTGALEKRLLSEISAGATKPDGK